MSSPRWLTLLCFHSTTAKCGVGLTQGLSSPALAAGTLELKVLVKRDAFALAHVNQGEAFKGTLQRGHQSMRVGKVFAEEVDLFLVQRGVPRPVAYNAVLEGLAVHVAQLDLQESHAGVGVLANAHLVSDVFAADVVFQAGPFRRVEVQVVVDR